MIKSISAKLTGCLPGRLVPISIHAIVLGMIPDCLLDHVRAAGNAAGTGARMALLNQAARREIEAVVRRIEKSKRGRAVISGSFCQAMAIPHKSDPYAALAGAVDLPPRDLLAETPALAGGRRRGGGGARLSAGARLCVSLAAPLPRIACFAPA